MSTRQKEREIARSLRSQRNAQKILREHKLSERKFLVLKEVPFPHGRADIVIYGLYRDLYIVPIGIEIKSNIKSGTDLFYHISQVRETYEYAFTYIYLATSEIKESKDAIKNYLSELGYGLIIVNGEECNVEFEAKPKKIHRSEHDYTYIVSLGMLFTAMNEALKAEGYSGKEINLASSWIGLKRYINYCAFIKGNHAVFCIYALGERHVRELLNFISERKDLLNKLVEKRYHVYLESYLVAGGIRGYMHHLDEEVNQEIIEEIKTKVKRLGRGWGLGLGIYTRLWDTNIEPPSYRKALTLIRDELANLREFKEVIAKSRRRT